MKAKLLLGDCLTRMQELPDKSVDAIICDPPYGTTACKWDSIIPLDLMWAELKRIIKPNGAIVLFGSQPFTTKLIASNYDMFKYCWVWEKSKGSNFVHAKYQPLKVQEDIVVFSLCGAAHGSKPPMCYFPQFTHGLPYDKGILRTMPQIYGSCARPNRSATILKNESGDRYPRSVQKFKSASDVDGIQRHPTQKPVSLMEYLIKTYTQEGETVLDFTMGSGTTGVACMNTTRNFIGIELDENYFQIAKDRIEKATPSVLFDFK